MKSVTFSERQISFRRGEKCLTINLDQFPPAEVNRTSIAIYRELIAELSSEENAYLLDEMVQPDPGLVFQTLVQIQELCIERDGEATNMAFYLRLLMGHANHRDDAVLIRKYFMTALEAIKQKPSLEFAHDLEGNIMKVIQPKHPALFCGGDLDLMEDIQHWLVVRGAISHLFEFLQLRTRFALTLSRKHEDVDDWMEASRKEGNLWEWEMGETEKSLIPPIKSRLQNNRWHRFPRIAYLSPISTTVLLSGPLVSLGWIMGNPGRWGLILFALWTVCACFMSWDITGLTRKVILGSTMVGFLPLIAGNRFALMREPGYLYLVTAMTFFGVLLLNLNYARIRPYSSAGLRSLKILALLFLFQLGLAQWLVTILLSARSRPGVVFSGTTIDDLGVFISGQAVIAHAVTATFFSIWSMVLINKPASVVKKS